MRPDKDRPETLGFATQAVHAGNSVDPGTRAIRTPLVMANSYALPEDPSQLSWSAHDVPLYTRNSGANQIALQRKLAALEHGADAVVLASGVAALHAVFFTLLRTGDHAVVSDVTYEAVWRLFADILPARYGVEATFVDTSDPDAVRARVRPNTKLVHTEVIANPTTRVCDIAGDRRDRARARARCSRSTPRSPRRRCTARSTTAPTSSCTRSPSSSTATATRWAVSVIGAQELLDPIRADAMIDVGGVVSPFNAWLISRGAITLPLRLRQHFASAQRVAEFLAGHPAVAYVAYPGLPTHPQHALARRLFDDRGCGAVLAFALDGDADLQNRFVAQLRVVTSAVSLGHDESLIVHVGPDGPRAARWPYAVSPLWSSSTVRRPRRDRRPARRPRRRLGGGKSALSESGVQRVS